jgi:hypothetical protein
MIKQTLLTGWNFMRWLRLGLGVFIAIQAVQTHDLFSGGIAAFFLFQVATNTGCCGASSCAVPITKNNQDKTEDAIFEEVKAK